MPRLYFEELRIHRERLAQFVVVDTDSDHEFAPIKTTKRRIIDLNANNATPSRVIERHHSDSPHCGHDPSAGPRDEVGDVSGGTVADDTGTNHNHRAEVCETRREAKQLIAPLKHEWLRTLGGFSEEVGRKFDLDRSEDATQRPAGNCRRKIFDAD